MDPLIWTTKCPLANEISLYAEDWNHAIEHPEIIGKEELVKKIVEKPLYIQEGKTPFTAAYVFPPYNELEEGARVIVKFSTEVWPSGMILALCKQLIQSIQNRIQILDLEKLFGLKKVVCNENFVQ